MEPVAQSNSTSSESSSSSAPPGYHKPTKRKTTHDPFDDLPCQDNSHESHNHEMSQDEVSTFTKFIAAPLFFVSFLLSLSYVDRQNRSYRVSQHAQSSPTLWSRFTLRLSNWWDPEPYQDPRDGKWKSGRNTGASNDGNVPQKREKWFARKNQRKMANLELRDAFEMVDRMKAFVAGVFVVGTLGVGWGLKKVWERFYR